MARHLRKLVLLLLPLAFIAAPTVVLAVEVTDVLDAFEEDNPFDFMLRVRYGFDAKTATITREARCNANDVIGQTICKDGSRVVQARELAYERNRHSLFVDLRAGLYHDFEVYATLPIVMQDQASLSYAPGVDATNSTISGGGNPTATIFKVPYTGQNRGGFGDMNVGFKWAAMNYYRDVTSPTWVLGVDYLLPTGTVMKADNSGVGRGLHELTIWTTISRRVIRVLEPYFNLHAVLRFGATGGLFNKYSDTQVQTAPGPMLGLKAGNTFVPWENAAKDQRIEIDIGGGLDYVFPGREYSEVWEPLGDQKTNPCTVDVGCYNTRYILADPLAGGKHRRADGITDIQNYAIFSGWAGLHYTPIQSFQVSIIGRIARDTGHFLTYAHVGTDRDLSGAVTSVTRFGSEYSPTYLQSVDAAGNRLSVQDATTKTIFASLSGKF